MKTILILMTALLISTFASSQIGQTILDINQFTVHLNNTGVQFNVPGINRPGYRLSISGFSNTQAVIYSSSLWFAGIDANDNLHVSANIYNLPSRTFYPGPYSTNGSYSDPDYLSTYNQGFIRTSIWSISRGQILAHIANYNDPNYVMPSVILNWPAHGNTALGVAENLAPFVDVNGDGVYNPNDGDYPCVPGDFNVYMIMNDQAQDTVSNPSSMGLELHQVFYQFGDFAGINSTTTYCHSKIYNRGAVSYPEFRFGMFTDFDLGNPTDDFMGVDNSRNLAYIYNESNLDVSIGASIGWSDNPPAAGIKLLSSSFLSHISIPSNLSTMLPHEYWSFMNSIKLDGSPYLAPTTEPPYDVNTEYEPTWFLYDGNPVSGTGYSELTAQNAAGDRKTFTLLDSTAFNAGDSKTIDFVVLVAQGGNHIENVETLFNLADSVQLFFDDEVLSNGCFTSAFSSVSSFAIPDAIIYPNPARNHFFIQFQNMQPKVVRVYSTSGVLMHEQTVSVGEQLVQIDTESLASGMYIVQIGEVIRRVVVE
jgi:hypothetical protein